MRKILDQSFPFVAEKSESTYRLVEVDGKRFIEKVTTSVSIEEEIPETTDPAQAFRDFMVARQTNRARNRRRIATDEAFIQHHAHGLSWQKIADNVGQKSGASIAKRASDFTKGLAHQYLNGANIHQLTEEVDLSANHLHSILANALEIERFRLLHDYESGRVMRGFDRDVARIVEITDFLKDWTTFEYQVVSPFIDQSVQIQRDKKILYTEDFFEIHRASGQVSRVKADALDGVTYHNWSSSPFVEALGLVAMDPIVSVFDMFGRLSQYYTDALKTPVSTDEPIS